MTIPSAGSPTLSGTVTSRKQNGFFPPTNIAHASWTNYGNTTTSSYAVGGLTQDDSYSLAIADLDVWLPQVHRQRDRQPALPLRPGLAALLLPWRPGSGPLTPS